MKKNKERDIKDLLKNKKLLFAPWAAEDKLYSSYKMWYEPFKKIFNNMVVFDPQTNFLMFGKEGMNRKFLEAVKKEKPDYIFLWLMTDEFEIETLLKIKKISPKTRIINFYGDDDTQFDGFTRYFTLLTDYNIMFPQLPKEVYKKEGIKNVVMTCGMSPEKFKPLGTAKEYEVSFAGTPKSDRYELVKFLKDNNVKIKVFGNGWEKYKDMKEINGGNKPMLEVVNKSKISICPSKNDFNKIHGKARIFEVAACKAFSLVEYFSLYKKFLKENKEIVFFKNEEELLKKIKYYLEHENEREKIAENAYNRVIKEQDINNHLINFFKKIIKDKSPNKKTPKINKKIITLNEEYIKLSNKDIANKTRGYDYVTFKNGNSIFSKYKDYFQAYSLIKSKKEVSICDYYIYSKKLGNYLRIHTHFAFFVCDKDELSKLLDTNQIMVTRDFLLKNLEKIRKFYDENKTWIVDKNKIAFVSMPLVQIEDYREISYENMKKSFHNITFMEKINSLVYQKKLFRNPYLYQLIIESILNKRWFVLKYLYKEKLNIFYLKKLIKMFN